MQIDKNARLKVAWFTAGAAGKPGLYEAESNNSGETFTDRVLVSENIVSGTPIYAADENGDFKIIWAADGKIYQSQLEANHGFTQSEITDNGDLPSAVSTGGKISLVFNRKDNEKRAVWLTGF